MLAFVSLDIFTLVEASGGSNGASGRLVEASGGLGTFTRSFSSSFLLLKKLLRSYLKPKKLLKKLHVNVLQDRAFVGLDGAS